jgi:hypothetical protein
MIPSIAIDIMTKNQADSIELLISNAGHTGQVVIPALSN